MQLIFKASLSLLLVASSSAQVSSFCAAMPNSTGAAAVLSASGSLDVASNTLTLDCANLPDRTFGAFMVGTAHGSPSTPANSVGNLCLTGSPNLFLGANIQQASGGAVSFSPNLASLPLTPAGSAALPGDTLHFQYWYRDISPAGGATSNFTSGVTVDFAPSFATGIFPLFSDSSAANGSRCSSCHSGTMASGFLDLSGSSASAIWSRLVDVPVAGLNCSAGASLRVSAGDPSNSKLLQLVEGTVSCGSTMTFANSSDVDRLRAWIAAGAPNN